MSTSKKHEAEQEALLEKQKRHLVEPYPGMYSCVDVQGMAWIELNGEKLVDGDPPSDADPDAPAPFTLKEPQAKHKKETPGQPDVWMQEDESTAQASCGCVIVRSYEGSGDPALWLCELHRERRLIAAAAEAQEIFGDDELERHAAELRKNPAVRVAALQGLYDVLKEGYVDNECDGSHTEYSFAQTLREIAADFETEVDGKHADWGGWLREKAKDVERAVAAAEKR